MSESYAATTIGTNISTDGTFGIATSSPGSSFSIGGVTNFTTATSTFYSSGGVNLSGGCFAVNGTCVGGGSSSGAMTLVSTQTSDGTYTNVAFTGLAANTLYRLVCNIKSVTSTGTWDPIIQLGTGAGPTWHTASSYYIDGALVPIEL